jgi:hypothetical protein
MGLLYGNWITTPSINYHTLHKNRMKPPVALMQPLKVLAYLLIMPFVDLHGMTRSHSR